MRKPIAVLFLLFFPIASSLPVSAQSTATTQYLRALNGQNPHSACSAEDLTEYCPDDSVEAESLIAQCSEKHGIKAAICYMQYLCENNHDQETITSHKECIDHECPLATHVPPLNCAKYLSEQEGADTEGVPTTDANQQEEQTTDTEEEGTESEQETTETSTNEAEETTTSTTSEPEEIVESPEVEVEKPGEQAAKEEEDTEGSSATEEENNQEEATEEEQNVETTETEEGTESEQVERTDSATGNDEGETTTTSTADTPEEFMESPEIEVEKPKPQSQEDSTTTNKDDDSSSSGGLHSATKAFLVITIPLGLAMVGWILYRRMFAPKENYPFDTHIQAATTTNENPDAQIT